MGKIVIRHNFETNSSSMHSLSYRRTDGAYTAEELERSESLIGEVMCDVIVTVDDNTRISGQLPATEVNGLRTV